MRVQDKGQIDAVKTAMQARLSGQEAVFAGYAPEQYALCQNGSAVSVQGLDVLFLISADKDAAVRAFTQAHSGRNA